MVQIVRERIDYACRSCGSGIVSHFRTDLHLGSPFVACKRCKAENLIPTNREYECLNADERSEFRVNLLKGMVAGGFFGFLLGAAVCCFWVAMRYEKSLEHYAVFFLASIALFEIFVGVRFWKLVADSRQRMLDPAHKEKVMALEASRASQTKP